MRDASPRSRPVPSQGALDLSLGSRRLTPTTPTAPTAPRAGRGVASAGSIACPPVMRAPVAWRSTSPAPPHAAAPGTASPRQASSRGAGAWSTLLGIVAGAFVSATVYSLQAAPLVIAPMPAVGWAVDPAPAQEQSQAQAQVPAQVQAPAPRAALPTPPPPRLPVPAYRPLGSTGAGPAGAKAASSTSGW